MSQAWTVTVAFRRLRLCLLLLTVAGTFGSDARATQRPDPGTAPLFGVAINARTATQIPDFLPYYGVQSVTPDNAMKMQTIGGCDGRFNFSAADQLLAYADAQGIQLHGQAVVWHKQTSWCANLYTKVDYETYVRTVVGHYCGRIPSMDIVNEALGSTTRYRTADESVWKRLYANDDYINDAFRWSRETCPEMRLYYNDYLIEWGAKSERMLALVRQLANEGLIDGVGFQAHFDRHAKLDQFAETMDRVAELDLDFAISELDVRLAEPYWELTAEDLQEQADIYREVAQLCLERPACVRLTVWGIDDGHSWINTDPEFDQIPDAPLLFDRDYSPKPAYCDGIQDVLKLPEGDCPLVEGGA
jgi:endo-1,4-beta-xylanase